MPDSLGFRDALVGLPEQIEAAFRRLTVTGPLPDHDDIANVLVQGGVNARVPRRSRFGRTVVGV